MEYTMEASSFFDEKGNFRARPGRYEVIRFCDSNFVSAPKNVSELSESSTSQPMYNTTTYSTADRDNAIHILNHWRDNSPGDSIFMYDEKGPVEVTTPLPLT